MLAILIRNYLYSDFTSDFYTPILCSSRNDTYSYPYSFFYIISYSNSVSSNFKCLMFKIIRNRRKRATVCALSFLSLYSTNKNVYYR